MSVQLTPDEIDAAAAVLAKLEPGYLPQLLFDQINRLHVTSTVVLVPLRKTASGIEVLMVQRGTGPNEPIWPGHWHLPGTMLRPTDEKGHYKDAFARLLSDSGELRGVSIDGQPTFLRTAFTETKRGPELAQVFFVGVADEPKAGAFFPVDRIPTPHIDHEPPYIAEAARLFK